MMWYDCPIPTRAPAGGIIDPLDNLPYRGGEFLPFYVPRPIMPQIDEEDYPAFFDFCTEKSCMFLQELEDPWKLRAHQHICMTKVINLPPAVQEKPIIVSKDDFILDGNHRWMYHRLHGSIVRAIRLMLPFEAAIALMFEFPKTYSLSMETRERD